jgi:two-component system chemotaxis response regulator CheB
MLQSALANIKVDHCVPLAQMGPMPERLIRDSPSKAVPVPAGDRVEAEIVERVLAILGHCPGAAFPIAAARSRTSAS